MRGRRRAQRGLVEADPRYADLVGRDTFYGWLASQRDGLFPDHLFAAFYHERWGRLGGTLGRLASALVLQAHEGVSDEEATAWATYDLRWKLALGVALDAKPFAKSTPQEFRARLIVHKEQRRLFQQSIELAKRRGELGPQRGLRLARLVQLGIRQARYPGRAKTLFQLALAATVANLTLLAGRGPVRLSSAGAVASASGAAALLTAALLSIHAWYWL